MSATLSPIHAPCPECAADVSLARPPLNGEVVRCRDCSSELEVTATAPLRLELAPQVQEDWGE
jgi:alpha-aminoadipate carrier protein LysW